jgi:ectoine hydroxylase-related dioxygenase (phytanoyl-CoA dioxygenase family)
MRADYVEHYRDHGFAVVRGVFDAEEVAALAAAFDRIYARGLGYERSFRHQNVCFRLGRDPALGRVVRMVQWPSYFDAALDAVRLDRRMLQIVAPLIGADLKQIINQMHWKPPGAREVGFGLHQDVRFRRPREAYRDIAGSYVQTGIAVDRHSAANGAMLVYPGSHRMGELAFPERGRVMDGDVALGDLQALGLDPAALVPLELAPGDVALWSPYTVHGSGANTTDGDRRLYLNGYVTAANCDRGEWTFRDGTPCPLGEPVLVHYEELYTRPEPHYLDD